MKLSRSSSVVVGHFGARGSGKSHKAKSFIAERRPPRLLVWDTMDEYGEHADAVPSLSAIYARTAAPRFALRYVPRGTDKELAQRFGAFCAMAYSRGKLVLVVEELQRVTTPSWAPADWSDCTLRGRHRELSIIGMSQRPASVDKNFFSMCDYITTGRLAFPADRRAMAEVLDVELAAVVALTGHAWIGRDMVNGRQILPADQKKAGARARM